MLTFFWGVTQRLNELVPLHTWLVLLGLVLALFGCRPQLVQASAEPSEPTLEQYMATAKRVVCVTDTAELVAAIKAVVPGDVVVLADGVYSGDATLAIFNQRATPEQPIVIIAEHQGHAVLQGTLHFDLNYSSHVIISGLVFNTQGTGAKKDIGAITIKNTHHTRITRNHFALEEQLGAHPEVMLDWVVIRGKQSQHNRVDHNLFENKLQRGRFIIVGLLSATDTMPQHTRIDHNHFRDMAPLGKNGMEAVVLGGGHPQSAHYMADQDAFSVFEYNLLERVDGECAEIISLKSSSNEIRYNTILDTHGSIYFRAGNRNAVYGNYFIGYNKKGSGGVRLYGEDQKVMHNYFSGLDIPAVWFGDANAPAFDPKSNLAPYTQVLRAEVSFNTFVDTNLGLARHLRDECTLTAQSSTISNNLLYSSTTHQLIDPLLLEEKGITWQGNVAYAQDGRREQQLVGVGLNESAVRWVDPQLVRSGFYPNYIYSIGAESPVRDAAVVTYAANLVDIEGKPMGATPDVGSFAYAGYPPLRGLLTAQDVGPNATWEPCPIDLQTPSLLLTGISLAGTQDGDAWYGPVTLTLATVGRDLTLPVEYQVQVDDQAVQSYAAAAVVLNTGEFSDGEHRVRVVVKCGTLQDEGQVWFTVANARILAPVTNAVAKGAIPIQIETSLPVERISSVQLLVGDRPFYQSAQLPAQLLLQTQDLPDSLHTLDLEIKTLDGVTARATTKFRTTNFWQTPITFAQPQQNSWFFSAAAEDTQLTAGWSYINDPFATLFGDPSRLVRTNSTTESCTWPTPKLTQAVISIYARTQQIEQAVGLAASTDGVHWQKIDYQLQTLSEADGWYELQLQASLHPGLYNHLRLTVAGNSIPAADLQLGHAELQGLN